jgi:hypothetical protein
MPCSKDSKRENVPFGGYAHVSRVVGACAYATGGKVGIVVEDGGHDADAAGVIVTGGREQCRFIGRGCPLKSGS